MLIRHKALNDLIEKTPSAEPARRAPEGPADQPVYRITRKFITP
ncbi:MAG: hypothetical protein OEZ59_10310 [Deltaproteobacteria bacterium]|nr:hypothetical protein [Deltaproteobacteria bacterium]